MTRDDLSGKEGESRGMNNLNQPIESNNFPLHFLSRQVADRA
ncbi:hypothetical protein ACWEQU_18685 [Streptomyces nodosus]